MKSNAGKRNYTFWKLDGAGNDFVALDNRDDSLPPEGSKRDALIAAFCNRQGGVGTDGALILEPPQTPDTADLRMRYHNRDGHEAEMCGNGARCFAVFALHLDAAPATGMRIETIGGLQRADVLDDGRVRLVLPDVSAPRRIESLESGGWCGEADFMRVGVPHSVVWVDDLDEVDVDTLGRALRHHAAFGSSGANVNFAQRPLTGKGPAIAVRTYERGVERETLACGTGSVATAISAVMQQFATPPVRIFVRGGVELEIELELTPEGGARSLSLTGPARIVFQGSAHWDPADATLQGPL